MEQQFTEAIRHALKGRASEEVKVEDIIDDLRMLGIPMEVLAKITEEYRGKFVCVLLVDAHSAEKPHQQPSNASSPLPSPNSPSPPHRRRRVFFDWD
jgi:hypothetical protein